VVLFIWAVVAAIGAIGVGYPSRVNVITTRSGVD